MTWRIVLVACVLAMVPVAVAHAQSVTATWTWTQGSGGPAQGFDVERKAESCTLAALSFAKIASTAANVLTYVDTALTRGTTYCYRVDAFNTAGKSPYSTTAEIAVPLLVPAAPSPPQLLLGP